MADSSQCSARHFLPGCRGRTTECRDWSSSYYVSSNYRLNSFGFSASEELAKEGLLNLGLKDQRLAVKWVKQHIN
jgi:carboxylesterase type B